MPRYVPSTRQPAARPEGFGWQRKGVGNQYELAPGTNGVATVTAVVVRDRARLAAANGVATVSAADVRIRARTGSAAGAATVSAAVVRVRARSASSTGVATVSATDVRVRVRSASAAGAATVTASVVRVRARQAASTGAANVSGTVSVSGVRTFAAGVTCGASVSAYLVVSSPAPTVAIAAGGAGLAERRRTQQALEPDIRDVLLRAAVSAGATVTADLGTDNLDQELADMLMLELV